MGKLSVHEQMEGVGGFLVDLGETMHNLSCAIRDDNEEEIAEIIDNLPGKREITKQLTLLGNLLNKQPWENKKAKRHAG